MSHLYCLTCIDCGIRLDLGKMACLDEGGMPIPWKLTGWRDQTDSHRIEGAELGDVIQRFLILHRGHELRVLSGHFLERADPDCHLPSIDTAAEVMERQVTPEPDPEQDADAVPNDVAERMQARFGDHRS